MRTESFRIDCLGMEQSKRFAIGTYMKLNGVPRTAPNPFRSEPMQF